MQKLWPGLLPALQAATSTSSVESEVGASTLSSALKLLLAAEPGDPRSSKQRGLGGSVKACVLGTAKAGKSMFINGLLGREYLPSDEAPETVGVVLVQGSSDPEHVDGSLFVFDQNSSNGGAGRLLAQGQTRINAKLREVNRLQREAAKAASEAWSPGQDAYTVRLPEEDLLLPITVPQLVLKVPFPAALTGQSAIGSFDLYDTPGPNEAHKGVKALVEQNARRILLNADVVIILIDFTQMGTDQEQQLLECVSPGPVIFIGLLFAPGLNVYFACVLLQVDCGGERPGLPRGHHCGQQDRRPHYQDRFRECCSTLF